jgi:hypothetical protein
VKTDRRPLGACTTILSLALLGMATAGCTGSADTHAAEPASPDGSFVAGNFADIPVPDGAQPLTDPTVDGRTTTQSFKVVGSGVEEVLGYYAGRLPQAGWALQNPPAAVGATDWRSRWVHGDETLEVSVSLYNGSDSVTTQLDLVLTR